MLFKDVVLNCFSDSSALPVNSRQHATSETVAEYAAALCKLAELCNFGDTLNEILCDRLVCGIANATVQKCLLTEPELTFTKAVTLNRIGGGTCGKRL